MYVVVLDIVEHWFVHENGEQIEQKRRHVSTWTDKEDALNGLLKWIENKSSALDTQIVYLANTIALCNDTPLEDKIVHIMKLFNRFSKVAAELNLKMKYKPHGEESTWAEISMFETKLRGSVFE